MAYDGTSYRDDDDDDDEMMLTQGHPRGIRTSLNPPPKKKKDFMTLTPLPPLSKTKSIISPRSAPNMSAKAGPTPAGTTQFSYIILSIFNISFSIKNYS